MSKEINNDKLNEIGITLNQFWGGDARGMCVQITSKDGFVQLSKDDAIELLAVLSRWIEGEL